MHVVHATVSETYVTNTEWKIAMHVAKAVVSKTCYNLQMIKGVHSSN